MKRGQSMSINVIIVAALGLIVLIVLAIIFMGKMNDTSNQTAGQKLCQSLGGQCRITCEDTEQISGTCGILKDATQTSSCCRPTPTE